MNNLVAVAALPAKAAVIVPAIKLPEPSLDTIALFVFALVAVVAVLAILPAVEIVAKLASVIPAEPDKFVLVKPDIEFAAAVIVLLVNVSVPLSVANVPLVGKVKSVAAVVFKVIAAALPAPVVPVVVNAAPVNKLPPSVIVLMPLSMPVPPFAGATIPVI